MAELRKRFPAAPSLMQAGEKPLIVPTTDMFTFRRPFKCFLPGTEKH